MVYLFHVWPDFQDLSCRFNGSLVLSMESCRVGLKDLRTYFEVSSSGWKSQVRNCSQHGVMTIRALGDSDHSNCSEDKKEVEAVFFKLGWILQAWKLWYWSIDQLLDIKVWTFHFQYIFQFSTVVLHPTTLYWPSFYISHVDVQLWGKPGWSLFSYCFCQSYLTFLCTCITVGCAFSSCPGNLNLSQQPEP